MKATATTLDRPMFRRGRNRSPETLVIASAYEVLLRKFKKLQNDNLLDTSEYNLIVSALRQAYLDRLAEVYVNQRIEGFIIRANTNICRSLSGYLDPHSNQEHQRLNHKSRQLSLLQ